MRGRVVEAAWPMSYRRWIISFHRRFGLRHSQLEYTAERRCSRASRVKLLLAGHMMFVFSISFNLRGVIHRNVHE